MILCASRQLWVSRVPRDGQRSIHRPFSLRRLIFSIGGLRLPLVPAAVRVRVTFATLLRANLADSFDPVVLQAVTSAPGALIEHHSTLNGRFWNGLSRPG